MNARILTILNAFGCLVLLVVIASQWRAERALGQRLESTTRQLSSAREDAANEAARRTALERDIAVLKEAIESTQQAAEATNRDLAEKSALATGLQSELDAARTQAAAWEQALQSRDTRIRELGDDLAATRKRLDQAVDRLKQAAERKP